MDLVFITKKKPKAKAPKKQRAPPVQAQAPVQQGGNPNDEWRQELAEMKKMMMYMAKKAKKPKRRVIVRQPKSTVVQVMPNQPAQVAKPATQTLIALERKLVNY